VIPANAQKAKFKAKMKLELMRALHRLAGNFVHHQP
jgi:hypothetical protein